MAEFSLELNWRNFLGENDAREGVRGSGGCEGVCRLRDTF